MHIVHRLTGSIIITSIDLLRSPLYPARVLSENFEELLHIVHRPTVQLACQKSTLMFRSIPRALFITPEDRGFIYRCVV